MTSVSQPPHSAQILPLKTKKHAKSSCQGLTSSMKTRNSCPFSVLPQRNEASTRKALCCSISWQRETYWYEGIKGFLVAKVLTYFFFALPASLRVWWVAIKVKWLHHNTHNPVPGTNINGKPWQSTCHVLPSKVEYSVFLHIETWKINTKYDKPSFSHQSHPRILHYGLPGFWDNVEPAMAFHEFHEFHGSKCSNRSFIEAWRPGRPGRRSLRSPIPSSLDKARRKMARTSASDRSNSQSCGWSLYQSIHSLYRIYSVSSCFFILSFDSYHVYPYLLGF